MSRDDRLRNSQHNPLCECGRCAARRRLVVARAKGLQTDIDRLERYIAHPRWLRSVTLKKQIEAGS